MQKNSIRLLLTALAASLLMFGCKPQVAAPEAAKITVKTARPIKHTFRDAIRTQGVVAAQHSAILSANVPGKLDELLVESGDVVKKGQKLFQSDRDNLENARKFAAETVRVAEERVKTRTADVELARLSFNKAELDYTRTKGLYATNAASKDTFETAELKFNKTRLEIEQAEAALDTAKAEVALTTAALAIADKQLADSAIYAPYDGIVVAKYHNANEFLNAGTPVVKVEVPDAKRIELELSAVHFAKVKVGETRVAVQTANGEIVVPVTMADGAINPVSRTFTIKADLPAGSPLPSGLLADATVIFGTRESMAVPEEAVLYRAANGYQVFVIEDGIAHGKAVTQGIVQDGFAETPELAKLPDAAVVVSGQYFLSEGSPVKELAK